MDHIAERVAHRFVAELDEQRKQEITDRVNKLLEQKARIEKIPGWDRSNFLLSLHDWVKRRGPLSEKQLAALAKIEKEQAARAQRQPQADVLLNPKKQYLESHEIASMIKGLVGKPSITVYDPRGLVAPNQKLHSHIVHALAAGFWGQAEMYAEYNADEDDRARREQNSKWRSQYEAAGHDMEHAKLHAKQDGPITTLTLTPSYHDVVQRHHLR